MVSFSHETAFPISRAHGFCHHKSEGFARLLDGKSKIQHTVTQPQTFVDIMKLSTLFANQNEAYISLWSIPEMLTIDENVFDIVICKMSAFLSRPQYV